jgi:predicted lipid-binding transport protein (Tim44 family)
MSPRQRRTAVVLAIVAAGALLVAPGALASAGGGSSGFSGGGGGGGGGGSGFALFIIIRLLIDIALIGHGLGALFLIAVGLLYLFVTRVLPRMQESAATRAAQRQSHRRGKPSDRERRVELAAAEAAEEDPDFAPDSVRAGAVRLFLDIQRAWDAGDRFALRGLVAPDLLVEWERRLDDFARRGWRNHVEPVGEPRVEYVGLTHTGDPDTDRVVVRIDARVRDYVVDAYGQRLKRTGKVGEMTRVREFWTLQKRQGRWVLASIEQGGEGAHALQEQVVATAWSDEQGLRDEALVEGAVADAVPAGTSVAEVADLQYAGDARAAANDLSLADGRFAPDVLEVAARRAVDAWARAIDGDDAILDQVATPAAKRELLYAGDTSGSVRMVVRGPVVKRIRIISLDAAAEPPTMTVEVDLTGRRYVENRDTAAVLAGSRSRPQSFTERWTFAITADSRQPWRIVAAAAPVGLV